MQQIKIKSQSSPVPLPSNPSIPDYLRIHYAWAYIYPKSVRFFERQWLVNLILWGSYKKIANTCIRLISSHMKSTKLNVLQIACAYGDVTPNLANKLERAGSLDVIDVLPVQLTNLRLKLSKETFVQLHCMDSTNLNFIDNHFDKILIYFLLHEQPTETRKQTLTEAIRVVKPGGEIIIADYSKPAWWNPLRYIWNPLLSNLEPFAVNLLNQGLTQCLPITSQAKIIPSCTFLGGAYEVVTLQKLESTI
jgi:ubiquinone/menaquinone biosynthesis C-methylase UbiE